MDKKEQEFIVQQIRTQYTEKEPTKIDELKELDAQVKRPVQIFSYIFGAVGALIMGSGMSVVMTDNGKHSKKSIVAGILVGIAGMAMTIVNYPLYDKKLKARREQYADRIIELSDEIMEG